MIESNRPKEASMSHEGTMRQFYDHVNAGDIDGFMAMISDDLIEHEEIEGIPPTKEGVRQFFEMFRAAFSDLRMDPELILSSGDKAVAYIRMTGTHDGEFMGMPATGKSVDFKGVDIVRFNDDGLGVEHWGVTDTMTMMVQLGAVPAPA
jgi:steroid delta-isomerase-like uncharacterized protein